MIPFITTAEADLDSDNFFIYIAQHNPAKANNFLGLLEETFHLISKFPEIAPLFPSENKDLNIRWFPVKDFPNHLIFYRIEKEFISILRIFHKSQDIRSIL